MSSTDPPTWSIVLRSSRAFWTACIVKALRPMYVRVLSWTQRPSVHVRVGLSSAT